jgi:hypothetical protein
MSCSADDDDDDDFCILSHHGRFSIGMDVSREHVSIFT